jgi:hypothetical protein
MLCRRDALLANRPYPAEERVPTGRDGSTGWQTGSLHAILQAVAGDRWLDTRFARGKSEHRKAACLVKSRALEMQIPGDGECHRKYTAQHYLRAIEWTGRALESKWRKGGAG